MGTIGPEGDLFSLRAGPAWEGATCFDSTRSALLRRIAYEAGMYTVRRLSGCLSDLRPLPPGGILPKGETSAYGAAGRLGGGRDALALEDDPQAFPAVRGLRAVRPPCARKLSTSELLADLRSQHPHWTQFVWDIWIRRVGPLWPLAGRIASLPFLPGGSSLETARALLPQETAAPWGRIKPAVQVGVGTPVAVFAGCTARNARPGWIARAETLLRRWGYVVLDGGGFTCCGGTLHHAGLFAAQAEVRRRNIERWRDMGRPVIAAFCASCKHGLDAYAEEGGMEPEEDALWKRQVRGLSALLAAPVCETVPDAPARIGYHQPCHWGEDDPDLPFLRQAFPLIMKGTGLCCGMGGILKMTDADVSAAIGRRCVEGFADCRHIITGCSGCTLQLASAAPSGVTVRHWLDVVDISV